MAFPVLHVPESYIKLQSQTKPVKVRPYLVGEEKILLMAQQSEDPEEVKKAIGQILETCTFGKLDIQKLPSFDLEYLFIQLRAISVGSDLEVQWRCQNKVEDKHCGNIVPCTVDLNKIQTRAGEGHTRTIMFSTDTGVKLRYPTTEILNTVESKDGVFNSDLVERCIETIYSPEGVHEVSDGEEAELKTFVERLSVEQFAKIQNFFDTMPTLTTTVEFRCSKCGYQQDLVLSGLMDFFV